MSWLAALVPEIAREGSLAEQRRARLVLGVGLCLAALLAWALFLQIREGFAERGVVLALGLCGIPVAFWALRRRALDAAGQLLCGVAFGAIAGSLWYSGAALIQVLYFAALVPLVATLLLGTRSTAFWGVLTLLLVAGAWLLDASGYAFSHRAAYAESFETRFRGAIAFLTALVGATVLATHVRSRTMHEALANEERLRNLIEHSPLGMCFVAPDLTVEQVNQALVDIVGAPDRQALEGRDLREFRASRLPAVRDAFDSSPDADEDSPAASENSWVTSWGRTIHARTHLVPVRDQEGHAMGLQLILEDVSERRDLEERLRQSQKLEAVGQLAGGVAHDFNNLLTVVTGSATLLRESADPETRESAQEILKAAARGAAVTRQLLTFGRAATASLRSCDLAELLDGLRPTLQGMLRSDVALEFDLAEGLPPVIVDQGLLEQALTNLVLNARDALPGSGRIRIEARRAAAPAGREREAQGWVALVVQDDGDGMAADVAERAFEPFFTTKGAGEGTGLGLAMVYGAISRMGGDVRIESKPGDGTSVTLCLCAAAERARGEPASATSVLPGGSETILLVEDDVDVRQVMERSLRARGYRVISAEDAERALDIADEMDGRLDLVVSDVVMPGRSGPELAAQLRQRWPDLQILFVSGYPRSRSGQASDLEGAVLLPKPFDPSQLARGVRELLERTQA